MRTILLRLAPCLFLVGLAAAPLRAQDPLGAKEFAAEVDAALKETEEKCAALIESKKLPWKKVAAEFRKRARDAKTYVDQRDLLVELLARLRDGHAGLIEKDEDAARKAPRPPELFGPGMFWTEIDGHVHVKNVWGASEKAGVEPGDEILSVDGVAVAKWVAAREAEIARMRSFSTDHQARFTTLHRGLAAERGTRMKLEIRDAKGKKRKRNLVIDRDHCVPFGPAYPPEDLAGLGKNIAWAKTEGGHGYIQVRRCRSEVVDELDRALAAIGEVSGVILDFRGNSGGGFDHEAFLGRFIPEGKSISFARKVEGAGPLRFGGPVVVIVDGNCASAGETGSGMFKEEGRGYVIGESPSAGMSSQKTTIELPSGRFALYVSTHSNKSWYNDRRGLEGIGVIPHETVSFTAADLAAKRDTLILRAEAPLADFPQKAVPYRPEQFGWKTPRGK
ncbi:MAG: S41 family peptidase [Planctomycetota bacterium]